jgi:hypothetical protein
MTSSFGTTLISAPSFRFIVIHMSMYALSILSSLTRVPANCQQKKSQNKSPFYKFLASQHIPESKNSIRLSRCRESDPRPLPYHGSALPAELQRPSSARRRNTFAKFYQDKLLSKNAARRRPPATFLLFDIVNRHFEFS